MSKDVNLIEFLSDSAIPTDLRSELLLKNLVQVQGSPALVTTLLQSLELSRDNAIYKQAIKDLKAGPLRSGLYMSSLPDWSTTRNTVEIIFDDGQTAYPVLSEEVVNTLFPGDRVLVDVKGQVVLGKLPNQLYIGEEATFERLIDNDRIEISLRDQERFAYRVTQRVQFKIQANELNPGDKVVINTRQYIALDALSTPKKARFKYLTSESVPDVIAVRDIGNPNKIIEDLEKHITIELTRPETRRRYNLPRSVMNLFLGIPGGGKTYTIEAIWRIMYEIMSRLTGCSIDQLPQRVFRARTSTLLSKWFGEAEKNIDGLFDEIISLSDEKWTAPDGKEWELPVLVIMEEVDGLARARGGESHSDRVLTCLLQRLDPNRADLKDRLIIFIGTSNLGAQIDIAFLRRLGSNIVKFGKLDRIGFGKVLGKQIASLPLECGSRAGDPHDAVVADITAWLFSRNGSDPGVVELTYAGSTTPEVRYRREFLTGALVNRSVNQAAVRASNDAYDGLNGSGLHIEHLVEAINQQILATVDQMSIHNVSKFLELPDGVRVASLRRLPQPGHFPLQLQSN